VDYIHTAKDIVKLLQPGSPAYQSSFLTPCADTQFQGELRQRGRKIHGGGKIIDFLLKLQSTVRDRPMITMER